MPASHELLDVELRHVTKRFGGMVAVDDVTMTIPRGAFFSLLGPSGCGKTTTLRMIGGFEEPSQGEVLIGNTAMGSTPPYLRPVNTVFQSYALFPHLDVFENVAFGLRRRSVPPDDIKKRVGESLAMVNLTDLERRRVAQLSGGQQQRVALARALVNRPAVLLLDEPLAALDPKLRKAMQSELKRLQREVGITFIMVTHDQEEALTMSDQIAVMHQGRLEQLGTPREVYEMPATHFVADFIGRANFLPGVVVSAEGCVATVRLEVGGEVVAPALDVRPGRRVELMVRPEALRLGTDGGLNHLSGTLAETVYLGAEAHYHVRLSKGELVVAGPATATVSENCTVSWRPDDGRLLLLEPGKDAGTS